MAIVERSEFLDNRELIDLAGGDGNAFVLLGIASRYAKALEIDFEPIQEEMMSGDYEHLLETLEEHFGRHLVILR
jgi:hypothetical protein